MIMNDESIAPILNDENEFHIDVIFRVSISAPERTALIKKSQGKIYI